MFGRREEQGTAGEESETETLREMSKGFVESTEAEYKHERAQEETREDARRTYQVCFDVRKMRRDGSDREERETARERAQRERPS